MSENEKLAYFTELEESKKIEKENFKQAQKKKAKIVKSYDNLEQIKKKEGVIEIPEIITVKEFTSLAIDHKVEKIGAVCAGVVLWDGV